MSFDAEVAFKQIQGQLDTIAAELSGIRQALRLDDGEAAKSFLFWRIGEDGIRQRAFDTTAFFADYHRRHGLPAEPVDNSAANVDADLKER